MNHTGSVLVASQDPHCLDLVAALAELGIRAEVAATREAAERLLSESHARWVAVVDGDLPAYDGWQLCRLLQVERSIPCLQLFPASLAFQLAPLTQNSRAQEFALKPLSLNELVLRVKVTMLRAGFNLQEPGARVRKPMPRPARALHVLPARDSKIVAVFSLKGGSGKSTIAVNTAVGLAQLRQQRVMLVDADLWTGDVAVLMNIAGRFSVADLCARDTTELEPLQQMLAHHPSGVQVLQRPFELTVNEQLPTEPLVRALPVYKTAFDSVIVNMSSALDELNLQILDVADVILLITTPEIAAITNTARFLEVGRRVGYIDRTLLVLNRANSGINVAAVEETLRCPVAASLVSDGRAAVESANQGVPLMLCDPTARRPLTQGFMQVIEQLAGPAVTNGPLVQSKNVLSFMRKLAG